ncbi:MAG: glycine cleavage system protein H [Deltaproteobacteria bacterium]|nr:glycine cleavage system protein H [Deltaproteobacteria bacterium]MBW2047558.1 glycine cleavage system protein H [Deltaproteobacteria bacterium]MBW2111891.1 glycine cleavage system protein H [Deltaproteobacteria bacterium]MBW2352247.1 glycine cleavage system protein H [Deltaproteobacteria bacterium]HDZ91471.1 glycine cleavage system protein H [Deltaproteobacteria bacterium]
MPGKGKVQSMKIVPPGKKKCVWMEAGVVSYKLCDNNYDCPTCVYDHAMQTKVARQKESMVAKPAEAQPDKFTATWVEKMMMLPASSRKCRYMITGEIGRKLCPNAYECGTCSFDRMMQQRLQSEPMAVSASVQVAGFEVADGFYYHEGHTWARPEYGGRVRVGLDDFARRLIGKLSGIEMPGIGHELKQGEAGFGVRRNGKSAGILSPVDGVVTRINDRLLDHPELVNASPYEEGWFAIVEPTRLRKNLKDLYYGEEAHTFTSEEKERLFSMANDDLNIAADGGISVEDISEELEETQWLRLVKAFLRSK